MRLQFFIRLSCSALALVGGFVDLSRAEGESETPSKVPDSYVEEASLPEGFPPPSKIGEVVEKTYPILRSYSATGTGAFMKCFGYLSLNSHKMTAPVVMEVKADAEPNTKKSADGLPFPIERMHFLLEKNSLDDPKESGPITVADMPSIRVLSIAFQEKLTAEAVKEGKAALESRLKEMPTIERAGEYRILGDNSPMLDQSKNYWELQLPIKKGGS